MPHIFSRQLDRFAWWLTPSRATSDGGALEISGQILPSVEPTVIDALELESRVLYSAAPVPLDMAVEASVDVDVTEFAIELADEGFSLASDPEFSFAYEDFESKLTDQIEDDLQKASESEPGATEIVFVDAGVEDWQSLLEDLKSSSSLSVVLLDANQDGVAQMTRALADQRGLTAIHLISHGDDNQINFGSTILTDQNLAAYAGEIETWNDALADGVDFLIYGCNLAASESGRDLIGGLGALCDCDVAASQDITGHDSLGGDWDLEYVYGDLETSVIVSEQFQSNWVSVLPTATVLASYEPTFAQLDDSSYELKSDQPFGQTFVFDSADSVFEVDQVSIVLSGSNDAEAGQVITVSIRDSWNGAVIGSNSISVAALTTSEAWYDFDLGEIELNDSQTYFIRVDNSQADGKIYLGVDESGSYANGDAIDKDGDAEAGEDAAFRVSRAATRTLTVDTASDLVNGDTSSISALLDDRGSDGLISLREAIEAANNTANGSSPDVINFDIAGGGVQTISLAGDRIEISDAVILDASTQSGYSFDTPVIEIDGTNLTGAEKDIFWITGGGTTVRGFALVNARDVAIDIEFGDGNTIAGNFIGVGADGITAAGNRWGIAIKTDNNIVGGDTLADRNIISSNTRDGVVLHESDDNTGYIPATGNVLKGNWIGIDLAGNAMGNSGHGIRLIEDASGTLIGGVLLGEANIIAHHGLDGVSMSGAGAGNVVRGNQFFSNSGLAIDLENDDVTANDSLDSDSGANELQNFPVLSSVVVHGTDVTIDGSLQSKANTSGYIVDFYWNGSNDPSMYGEAENYIGSTTVSTDGSGNASFSPTFMSANVPAGAFVSATVTDANGNTSEFALNVASVENLPPTANAGGAYSISEGDSLVLNGSASSDPEGSALTYEWDLDGDLVYGDVTGAGTSVSWSTLTSFGIDDDNPSITIGLRVTDEFGQFSESTSSLAVANVAPIVVTTGAASVNDGSVYTLNLSTIDPGNELVSSWTINWGDGAIETFSGNPSSVTHTYTGEGMTYNILAAVTDGDGTFMQNELLVTSYATGNSIYRFAATTGALVEEFAAGEGLDGPVDVIIGPDGNLYVSGEGSDNVLRYNAVTGAFIDEFVVDGSGGLNSPGGLAFGADGNLYVASNNNDKVLRYDGVTGAFIDEFVSGGSGGLDQPYGLVFGPDGNLYVNSYNKDEVLRFDGTTGAFIDTFVTPDSGGLDKPEQMVFGPDGNLYIASFATDEVLRYDGSTGAFIDAFVTAGLGGLDDAAGLAFGPDGNLYVSDYRDGVILRYNGQTGAFIDEYASSGINSPAFINFLPQQQVAVVGANDAPVLADTVVTLNSVDEDAGVPVGAVGTLISSIVDLDFPVGGQDNVSDLNVSPDTGVAITAADTANGTWYFSTDNGAVWNVLGAVDDASARVLAADASTRVYFQGNSGFEGTISDALTFRAWDQSDAHANGSGGIDTTTNGGTTAFSVVTDVAEIVVNSGNHAPVIDDQSFLIDENLGNGSAVGSILSADDDSGANGTRTYAMTGGTGSTAFAVDNLGQITVVDSAQLDFETSPTYMLDIRVTDGGTPGLTDTATVTINLADINEAPSVSLASALTNLSESTDTTASVKIADIIITDDSLGSNDLTLTGTDASLFDIFGTELHLKAGTVLDFETSPTLGVSVEVDDPTVGSNPDDTTALLLSINDANDAPTAMADSVSTAEDTFTTVNVLGNDNDPDSGDSLTVSIVPGGGPSDGTAAVNVDNTITYSPNANFAGTDTITYQIDDGNGGIDQATLTVSVGIVNDAPTVVAPIGTVTVMEDDPVTTISLLTVFSDVDDSVLSYRLVTTDGDWLAGSAVVGSDLILDYRLNQYGTAIIVVEAEDAAGLTVQDTVTLNVAPVNDQPEAENQTLVASPPRDGAPRQITGNFLDLVSDLDGDSLTVTITAAPTNGLFTFEPTGEFVFQPDADFFGTTTIDFVVSDGTLASNTATITLRSPIVVVPDATPSDEGSDEDGSEERADEPSLVVASVAPIAPSEEPTVGVVLAESLEELNRQVGVTTSVRSDIEKESQTDIRVSESLNSTLYFVESTQAISRAQEQPEDTRTLLPVPVELFSSLTDFSNDLDEATKDLRFAQLSTVVSLSGVSVGAVTLAMRGAILFAPLLAQLPAWQVIDPIVVLGYTDHEESDDDEASVSVLDIVESEGGFAEQDASALPRRRVGV